MNIHNLNFVKRVYESLERNKRTLASITTSPQMVTLSYSGDDLGISAKYAIIEQLKTYYQTLIDEGEKQLKELGVDLEPLPEPSEEEDSE